MIIVEGPDGSGKTTLCKQLCEDFGLKMGERETRDRDKIYETTRRDTWRAMFRELMGPDLDYTDIWHKPQVWDRIGPISDPVYSLLDIPHKRRCAFTRSELDTFHYFLRRLGLLIVCLPPLEVVQANVAKEHQLDGVVEQTEAIWNSYNLVRPLGSVQYDYTMPRSYVSISVLVHQHLKRRKERECFTSSTPATSESSPNPTEA